MASTVPNEADLAAQVVAIRAEMDALDRGLIEASVTASLALSRADALEHGITTALHVAGADDESATVSFADPVATRLQSRRRRIEKSGFVLVRGGGAA
jgi:hypothetical protein